MRKRDDMPAAYRAFQHQRFPAFARVGVARATAFDVLLDRRRDLQGAIASMPEIAIFFRRERLPFHVKNLAQRMSAFQQQESARFHPVAQARLLFF